MAARPLRWAIIGVISIMAGGAGLAWLVAGGQLGSAPAPDWPTPAPATGTPAAGGASFTGAGNYGGYPTTGLSGPASGLSSGAAGSGVFPTPVPIHTPVLALPAPPTPIIALPGPLSVPLGQGASPGGCPLYPGGAGLASAGVPPGCPGSGVPGLDLNGLGPGVPGLGLGQATDPAYSGYYLSLPPVDEDQAKGEAVDETPPSAPLSATASPAAPSPAPATPKPSATASRPATATPRR